VKDLRCEIHTGTGSYTAAVRTGKLEALEVAFQAHVALSEMLKQVQQVYGHSYGHDFELTK
jgi:hypothetical protein